MSDKIIHVVIGTTGEYSDRGEWVVRAFHDEATARAFVESASAWARDWVIRHEDDRWSDAADADKSPFDPDFACDYTGTHYFLRKCPLSSEAA